MGVPFAQAMDSLDAAIQELFDSDPRVRAVGITHHGEAFGYRAVRNSAMVMPLGGAHVRPIDQFKNVPIIFADTFGEVESLVMVPDKGPASPAGASFIPEVNRHRHLVCGLQIQNFDDDFRQGIIGGGFIIVGTLGCFVRLANNNVALLSNNHVVAGENRGQRGTDRILQPGRDVHQAADQVAVLTDFVALQTSPAGAMPHHGTVVYNDVDAAVAELDSSIQSQWVQIYLSYVGWAPPLQQLLHS